LYERSDQFLAVLLLTRGIGYTRAKPRSKRSVSESRFPREVVDRETPIQDFLCLRLRLIHWLSAAETMRIGELITDTNLHLFS
jgi:hypothetical protein